MKVVRALVRRIRRLQRHAQASLMLRMPQPPIRHLPGERQGDVELIVITFNNPDLLPVQADLFARYAAPGHILTVADNSSKPEKRSRIESICRERGLTYIGLPESPFLGEASNSHGFALNWVTKQYVARRRPEVFGYLDHDIFPTAPFDARKLTASQPVYGLKQERGHLWYLWPGYCFFRTSAVKLEAMNFMPARVDRTALDTGGGNCRTFRSMGISKIAFASHSYIRVRKGQIGQDSHIERIDTWLHMFNGSYWLTAPAKEREMWALLPKD